jgi:hypothetical protein
VPAAAPKRVVEEIALLRREQIDADPVDAGNLPVDTYDPGRVRRVGDLTVVPVSGIRACDPAPARIEPPRGAARPATSAKELNELIAQAREGACLVRGPAARCFTLDQIRAGKAFALIEEPYGSRVIGLITDDWTRIMLTHRGVAAFIDAKEGTIDNHVDGLKRGDEVGLNLSRYTPDILVVNDTGIAGLAEAHAKLLRPRLRAEVVTAAGDKQDRAVTVVTSTSPRSNRLAKETAELLEADRVELAPEGSTAKPATPGVIVSLGKDRMR